MKMMSLVLFGLVGASAYAAKIPSQEKICFDNCLDEGKTVGECRKQCVAPTASGWMPPQGWRCPADKESAVDDNVEMISSPNGVYKFSLYGNSRNTLEAVYKVISSSTTRTGSTHRLEKTLDLSTWKNMPEHLDMDYVASETHPRMEVSGLALKHKPLAIFQMNRCSPMDLSNDPGCRPCGKNKVCCNEEACGKCDAESQGE